MKSTWSRIHKKSTNVIVKGRLFVYESLPFIDSAFGTKLGIPRGLILLPFLTLLNGFFGTFSSLNLSSIFSRSWTSSSKYHLFVSLISNLEMRDSQFLSSWWSRSWFFGTSSGSKHDRLLRIHFLKTFCENFELGRRLVRDDFNFSDFFHLLSNFIWVIVYDSKPMKFWHEQSTKKPSWIPLFAPHVCIWDQHESKFSVKSGHFLAFSAFSLHDAVFAARPEHSLRSAIQLMTFRQRLQW